MKVTYTIPDSKKDISTEAYIAVTRLYNEAEKEERGVDSYDLVSAVLGLPISIIKALPLKEYEEALQGITKALNETPVLELTFKHKGKRFGFIPDLENMSIGGFSALDVYLKDVPKYYLHLLSVLYRPIKKENTYRTLFGGKRKAYDIVPYDSDTDLNMYKDLPCNHLDAALVFFYNLRNELKIATLKYTAEELQTKEAQNLGKSGDGIKHTIRTLRQSELEWRTYTKSLLIKYCID